MPRPYAGHALTPHAGWMYSGSLAAAYVPRRVAIPDGAIVLCPKTQAARTPPGRTRRTAAGCSPAVKLDFGSAVGRAAGRSQWPGLELDAAAHREEHAIEVHLPLLFLLAPPARKVRITWVTL